MPSAKRYARRKAEGRCGRCGAADPLQSATLCEPCRAEKAAWSAERYARRKEAGVCGECGKYEPMPGCVTCWRCSAGREIRGRY